MYILQYTYCITSVVDRHCFEANPDPNFDADPDPDPDLEWPTPSFTYVGKSEFLLLLIIAFPL
jgi:hypothetical protein